MQPISKEKIENKILNLAEQLIEINGIYESNNEIYEKFFSFKEPEFKSVESIFYKTLNIIEEIEILIYSNKVDVEYLKILDMGLMFAEEYGFY